MSTREQPILFLSQFDFTDNFGGLFFVFLNVVSPVFILVVIGYFIGQCLNVKHVHFREQPIICSSQPLSSILSAKPK